MDNYTTERNNYRVELLSNIAQTVAAGLLSNALYDLITGVKIKGRLKLLLPKKDDVKIKFDYESGSLRVDVNNSYLDIENGKLKNSLYTEGTKDYDKIILILKHLVDNVIGCNSKINKMKLKITSLNITGKSIKGAISIIDYYPEHVKKDHPNLIS